MKVQSYSGRLWLSDPGCDEGRLVGPMHPQYHALLRRALDDAGLQDYRLVVPAPRPAPTANHVVSTLEV